jgi:glycine cleavage system H protein
MSEIPEGLRYTKEHEWMRVDGNEVIIGITDYAQNALTEIVWVEFQSDIGDSIAELEAFASVESVKSVSEIFAPLAGTLTAVNNTLQDTPESINEDPYGEGWIARFELDDASLINGLLDAAGYFATIEE